MTAEQIQELTELASALNGITFGFGGNAMDQSLKVGTARAAYNHNNTAGVSVFQVPGYEGMFGASAILPGEDDYAVAYHSSCAYTMFSGHFRAPSVPVAGLYKDHGELTNDGWR